MDGEPVMAKQSGMGDNFYAAGVDLSGDTGSLARIGGGPGVLDVTGINKSAPERTGGLRDGVIDWTSYFNPAAGQSHALLNDLPTADVIMSYCRGTALGGQCASLIGKQPNYDGTRAADGAFTFQVNALANAKGIEWGEQLTAGKRTDGSATNGSSIDYGAVSTAFGMAAYLHVFAFTGTSVTVTIEDSADNVSFAAIASGAFTAATGITSQRIATGTTATIRRYVRAVTSGVFSNAIFAVNFVRYLTAQT